ncbi:MAG TPA: type II toxin-antitoxin system VapC family toxin [Solirubrobacteraceae bacterium]|nr:type II toxin-antitoxin system VapC family toxin [Solirubrobacteraceae bacterium]
MPSAGEGAVARGAQVVCDASALVAALLDDGGAGGFVAGELMRSAIAAPALCPFETANIIRRLERSGEIGADVAAQAIADLLDLPIEWWPFHLLSERVWELRANLTSYDASYVALAELLDAPLLTLDQRIARAPGPRCELRLPD